MPGGELLTTLARAARAPLTRAAPAMLARARHAFPAPRRSRGDGRVAPQDGARDRGSVAVFTVVFAIAVIFLTALIVDGGNAMNARERAADIAGQAARAAAEDIAPAALRAGNAPGGAFPIDWASACGYAQQVVQRYGAALTGTTVAMTACPAQASGQTRAAVTVQITTRPLIGGGVLGTFTETATGTATSECGNAVQQGVC